MGNGKLKLPATRPILLAAIAGVVAGGVAVYVSGGYSGNNPGSAVTGPDVDDACAGKAEAAKAIAASATGDVAADAAGRSSAIAAVAGLRRSRTANR